MGSKISAFTLAEVLITLGVIGVVAALTIPVLSQNLKKQAYVTALRKDMSVLTQGFKHMLADSGTDNLSNTEAFGSNWPLTMTESNKNNKINEFSKYFKVSSGSLPFEMPKPLGTIPSSLMPSIVYIDYGLGVYNGQSMPYVCFILVSGSKFCTAGTGWPAILDVNGDAKPNTFGRDVFVLTIDSYGMVTPFNKPISSSSTSSACNSCMSSCMSSRMSTCMGSCMSGGGNVSDCNSQCSSEATPACNSACSSVCAPVSQDCDPSANTAGVTCASYLQNNNWKMDY